MNKSLRLTIIVLFVFLGGLKAQVPIVYYDFEDNTARNSTIQTTPELVMSTVGSPTFTANSITSSNGTGNGGAYTPSGGTGFGLGYTGFTTAASTTNATANNLVLGAMSFTGYSGITLRFDARRDSISATSGGARNIDIYYSTTGTLNANFTKATGTISVSASYLTKTFTLPAALNGAGTVYLRFVGYNTPATGSFLRIDNLTISADSYTGTADINLFNTTTHGEGLSSGGTHVPVYRNMTINAGANATNVVATSNMFYDGTIALTRGIFKIGNANSDAYTLTMYDAAVPFTRTNNGSLIIVDSSSLSFGSPTRKSTGASYNIPNNLFASAKALYINRANPLILGNNNNNSQYTVSLRRNLTLDSGVFVTNNSITLEVNGNILGNAGSHQSVSSGKISVIAGGTIVAGLSYGSIEISPVNGEFTVAAGGDVTLNGTLYLKNDGIFDIRNRTVRFISSDILIENNTFGSRLQTNSSTNLVFGTTDSTGGAAFGFPNDIFFDSPSYDIGSITVNRDNVLTFNNQSMNLFGTLTLTAGEVHVGANTTLTFQTGNTPIVRAAGTLGLDINGTNSLAFGADGNIGGDAFTIPDDVFTTTPALTNFSINRTNPLTLNNQDITLTGLLTLTSGTLVLADNNTFTLKSTSIVNTALVNVVGSSAGIAYGTGANFLIERYIPAGLRAFRLIAPAVNSGTGTFFTNWQESGVNDNGYGIQITGKKGTIGENDATTGLDMTASGNASLFDYKVNTGTGNASYIAYTTTKATNDTISAYKAYLLTVRGNRQNDLAVDLTNMTSDATFRTRGQLVTGTVNYSTTGISNGGNNNTDIRLNFGSNTGFTLLGNPYFAPIDWVSIANNGVNSSVQGTYWLYDPTLGTNGAYVTYNYLTGSNNGSSAINQYIQPGQGFFIQNNATTSPLFQIRESDKAASTSNLTTTFSTPPVALSKIKLLFKKQVSANVVNMDGCVVAYSNTFSNGLGREDGTKFTNSTENISISNNNIQMSIDGRKEPTVKDSIKLRVAQVVNGGTYQLNIDLSTFAANGLKAYLNDRFATVKKIALNMGAENIYPFTTRVTNAADTLSFNNRFTISFESAVLPVSFVSINAYKYNNGINIDWSVFENNTYGYEVEYSANGTSFTKIGTVNSKGTNSNSEQKYTWFDNKSGGVHYYRIKGIDIDGSIQYSSMVMVTIAETVASYVSIYPNPVKENKANVEFKNIEKGNYNVLIYNSLGQMIYNKLVQHAGSSMVYSLQLPAALSKGDYKMYIISGNNQSKTLSFIIE